MGQADKKAIWNLIAKKLAGEASPEENRELERLLRNNPELHYPMQTISDMWKSSVESDRNAAEAAFDRHLERMRERQVDFDEPVEGKHGPVAGERGPVVGEWEPAVGRSRSGRRIVLGSILVIAVGLLTVLIRPFRRVSQQAAPAVARLAASSGNDIYTANGSRTHLTLPDGTLVWLNAGSRLTYGKNFNTNNREVSLTGEGFFDVARNSQKPFLIHTPRIDVRVLGTSFNLKSYPTDRTTEATLIHGSIQVSIRNRPIEKIILRPNEKLVIANDDSVLHPVFPGRNAAASGKPLVAIRKPTYEEKTGAIIETSWVDNKLIFREENFGDLARQMERWYGVTIQLEDPALEQLQFTGSFKEETIGQALEALMYTAKFNYKIEGNLITINR